jgi:hypothetical protein
MQEKHSLEKNPTTHPSDGRVRKPISSDQVGFFSFVTSTDLFQLTF